MSRMGFFFHESAGLPLCDPQDKRDVPLASWVTTDISTALLTCLDALAMVDDVICGREPFVAWDSENFEVEFSASGFHVKNLWVPAVEGSYPLDDVRETLEEYWDLLRHRRENPDSRREFRPDLPGWEAALLRWEQKWGRSHPYRGRLF